MTGDACWVNCAQRDTWEAQIEETCGRRGWKLWEVNCRSSHVHLVVTASGVPPKKIRTDLKAWITRCLKQPCDTNRDNWWAERGRIRFLYSEQDLEVAILYVTEGQEQKPEAS